jgi:signal transduction histidine kinase
VIAEGELRDVALFRGLGEERLRFLAGTAEERRLDPGDALFEQGATATHFFVLLEGALEGTMDVDGSPVVVFQHEAGGYIGAIPLITGEPYMACSKALVPSRLAAWDERAFRAVLAEEPGLQKTLLKVFAPAFSSLEGAAHRREKLAALGGLAAGLAHELNNPAAAARRAACELRSTIDALDGAASSVARLGLSPDHVAALEALRSEVAARRAAPPEDPLERGDREDELAAWLEAHGVERAWDLAPELVGAGLDAAGADRLGESLPAEALGPALEWLAAGLRARALASEVEEGATRVAGLVKAVKEYSYMDQAPEQEIDVRTGLDSTLIMLGHKLKRGDVRVERDYDPDLPRITAHGSELNQVWTNLIVNALDAMDGSGTLTLRTAREGDRVLVEVGDDGPGVPEEIRERIFEPFFTTKDVGEGTGIGLDVSHRIVVGQHHGDLRVVSEPGHTRFQVRLPLKRRRAAG